MGTQKDDLLELELLDENLKVRQQLIGDPVDRLSGITEMSSYDHVRDVDFASACQGLAL